MSTQSEIFGFKSWKKETKVNYNYKGALNTNHYSDFKDLCRLTQIKLKAYLEEKLFEYYDEVYSDDGFLYVKGTNSNVLLTAHMDTVHEPQGRICKNIYEYHDKKNKRHILSSPQGIGGDDRCGIYAILNILENTDFRPYIIFCEDEEVGGVGSAKFCKTNLADDVADNVSFMVEIDRANATDAVFYDEVNMEFQRFILDTTGNKDAYGSFSDICNLSEETLVSSFNISCGYYNAHTTDEYVVMEELEECIKRVIKLLEANKAEDIKYTYEPFNYYKVNYGWDNYGYGYSNSSKDDDDNYYEIQFLYHDTNTGKDDIAVTEGRSLEECIGSFMMLNPSVKWSDVYDYYTYHNR